MIYINDNNLEIGLYYILNIKTKQIYIGSSIMLSKRYKEHFLKLRTNKHDNSHLQASYNIYGDDSFKFIVFKTFDKIDDTKLRFYEGLCIRLFKSEYNMCIFPENSGKPNYKKKLSKEWIYNLHKNNNYKHKENMDIYNKVVIKNKNTASIVELKINNECFRFTTIKEACNYLHINSYCYEKLLYKCNKNNIVCNLIKTQKRKVQLKTENKIMYFNSAGECDRYLNLWRGCTSNAICHLGGNLFNNQVSYVL